MAMKYGMEELSSFLKELFKPSEDKNTPGYIRIEPGSSDELKRKASLFAIKECVRLLDKAESEGRYFNIAAQLGYSDSGQVSPDGAYILVLRVGPKPGFEE